MVIASELPLHMALSLLLFDTLVNKRIRNKPKEKKIVADGIRILKTSDSAINKKQSNQLAK